jgi:hypothetical protein
MDIVIKYTSLYLLTGMLILITMFINISIPEIKYIYVYFITMSINISIPERKYSYVYFITMFINISIPEHCNEI